MFLKSLSDVPKISVGLFRLLLRDHPAPALQQSDARRSFAVTRSDPRTGNRDATSRRAEHLQSEHVQSASDPPTIRAPLIRADDTRRITATIRPRSAEDPRTSADDLPQHQRKHSRPHSPSRGKKKK